MSGLVQRQESTPEQLCAALAAATPHVRWIYAWEACEQDLPTGRRWQEIVPIHAVIAALLKDKLAYEQTIEELTHRANEAERAVRDQLAAARAVLAAHDSQFTERGDE